MSKNFVTITLCSYVTMSLSVVFTPGTELKRELATNSYESLRKKDEEEKDNKKEEKKKKEEGSGPVAG